MRIAFLGTPEFAVPSLQALVDAGHEVALVVAQPDKPSGRGNRLTPPPVIERARELGLPTMQPVKVRSGEFPETIKSLKLDAAVVVAYGRILTSEVLKAPRLGCINVHASLLPRWRGAAPIQWSIWAGDGETGVCVQRMVEALDAGDVLGEARTPIGLQDTSETLTARLAVMGAELVSRILPQLEQLLGVPQDESKVTIARILKKEDAVLDWSKPANELDRQIRALHGWPGTVTTFRGQFLKIIQATAFPRPGSPGILQDHGVVGCGEGSLILGAVQLPGKKIISGKEFYSGCRVQPGEQLG
jgi:methionyl-tRNA formyltransferase